MNFPLFPRIHPKVIIFPWIFRGIRLLFPMSSEKYASQENIEDGKESPDELAHPNADEEISTSLPAKAGGDFAKKFTNTC